jgi:tetratricopeptide (TPR) repeat protein
MLLGDAAWEARAGVQQQRDQPGERPGEEVENAAIERAVAAYEAALAEDADNLELYWKLLRALAFQGEYVYREPEARFRVFERAVSVAQAAEERLAARLGGEHHLHELSDDELREVFREVPEAGPVYFWSAVCWGQWGDLAGKIDAVRQGLAGRLRDYAHRAVVLAPDYEAGGGHRFLGRLHSEAPRIPLVTPWVNRQTAIEELEKAVAVSRDEPLNLFFLADALLRFAPERRDEARALLAELRDRQPRPAYLIEDQHHLAEARKLFADMESR